MGLPRVGVTRCTHRHHRHLFCAFLSALIIKVADRHEAAIKRYWNAGKKRAEVKCNWGFFNRTTLSLLHRVGLGEIWYFYLLIFVWNCFNRPDRKQNNTKNVQAPCIYNPLFPPLHTHGRIPTGNKCQSSPPLSLLNGMCVLLFPMDSFLFSCPLFCTPPSLFLLEFQKAH